MLNITADTYFDKGVMYGNKGELNKALEYFQKCVELESKNVKFWNNLGNVKFDLGDNFGAKKVMKKQKKCYEKAVDLYTNYVDSWYKHPLA